MSITKSFNKHNGVYYAYETTYQWSETLKKKVQKKTCIGRFDPQTNQVVPNGRRGRPNKSVLCNSAQRDSSVKEAVDFCKLKNALATLSGKISTFGNCLSDMQSAVSVMSVGLSEMISRLEESSVEK